MVVTFDRCPAVVRWSDAMRIALALVAACDGGSRSRAHSTTTSNQHWDRCPRQDRRGANPKRLRASMVDRKRSLANASVNDVMAVLRKSVEVELLERCPRSATRSTVRRSNVDIRVVVARFDRCRRRTGDSTLHATTISLPTDSEAFRGHPPSILVQVRTSQVCVYLHSSWELNHHAPRQGPHGYVLLSIGHPPNGLEQ
jgi:hypothetical protein